MNAKIFSIVCSAQKGAFVHLETVTKVNIPQEWGLGKNVTKYTNKVVQVGVNYESAVNGRRDKEEKESNFKALSLPWGKWLVVDRVITHKDNTYYRFYDIKGSVKETIYYVDGTKASSEQMDIINKFLAKKSKGSSRQEIDNLVKPTNVKEDNILAIKCQGKEYRKAEHVTEHVAEHEA